MLERLDEVDWESLQHAYGPASDVPDLLRALASSDSEVRENAIYELYGNIWHQGTVYQASAYAVPFLIELLEQSQLPGRHEIVGLLQALGTGNSYLDVHGDMDWYRNQRETPEFQEKLQQELEWVEAARQAVVEGIDVYLRLASDSDNKLRTMLPYLLAICWEGRDRVEPVLQQVLAEDCSETARASALFGLLGVRRNTARRTSQSVPPVQQLAPHFRQYMTTAEEAPLVRLVAAECLVQLSDGPDVAEALYVAREMNPLVGSHYEELVWSDGVEPFSRFAQALHGHREAQVIWLKEGLESLELVDQALWAIDDAASESHSFAAQIAPALVAGLSDAKGETRKKFAASLARLGEAAIAPLEGLRDETAQKLRPIVEQTLKTIHERRAEYQIQRILKFPKSKWTQLKPTTWLVAQVERHQHEQRQDRLWEIQPAIIELGRRGSAAEAAVSVLRSLLDHENQWMRGLAAWALWQIEKEPHTIWAVLMEELQCRPVGFIALDCLSMMGPHAADAIPVLKQYIERDERLPRTGTTDSWNHLDDMFREACQSALAKIEGVVEIN